MTRFIDGPAQGKVLMLRRAPVYLRVVRDDSSGEIDALDQLDDTPKDYESLFAYQLVERPGMAFIDGPKCRGRYAVAEYTMVLSPPSDAEMRDTTAWGVWTNKRGMPEHLKKPN